MRAPATASSAGGLRGNRQRPGWSLYGAPWLQRGKQRQIDQTPKPRSKPNPLPRLPPVAQGVTWFCTMANVRRVWSRSCPSRWCLTRSVSRTRISRTSVGIARGTKRGPACVSDRHGAYGDIKADPDEHGSGGAAPRVHDDSRWGSQRPSLVRGARRSS